LQAPVIRQWGGGSRKVSVWRQGGRFDGIEHPGGEWTPDADMTKLVREDTHPTFIIHLDSAAISAVIILLDSSFLVLLLALERVMMGT